MSKQTLSELNLVNIAEAYELIKMSLEAMMKSGAKKHMNISLTGSPGIGKSSIVHQIAKELGMKLVDLRLSAMEESAVLGVPYVYQGIMDFSTPAWWPEDDSTPMILFLDELWSASPMVQTAAYRLILDRTIQNGKKLPDNCYIIAAGNLKSDKTGAKDPLPAAANRFGLHLVIDRERCLMPTLEYFNQNGFDIKLTSFLEFDKGSFYGNPGESIAFASPRTWEDVNTHLSTYPEGVMLNAAIAGAVGSEAAHKFSGFRENFGRLPDYNKVMNGDKKYEYKVDRGDIGLCFAVTVTAATHMVDLFSDTKAKNDEAVVNKGKNLMKLVGELEGDMQTIFLRTMKRNIPALLAAKSVIPQLEEVFIAITDRNVKN